MISLSFKINAKPSVTLLFYIISLQQDVQKSEFEIFLQFVRVMLNMGSDLGFFSIVWGILILAFSCAMLGAGVRDGVRDDEEFQEMIKPDEDDKPLPMQSWGTWWIMQTYLQSLGQVAFCSNSCNLHTYFADLLNCCDRITSTT